MSNDFYVGYDTPVPRGSRRFIFGSVAAVIATGLFLVLLIVATERPFADSSFAYGQVTTLIGRVELNPYPTLVLDDMPTGRSRERTLLVAPGKHGAAALVLPYDHQRVRLAGSLIRRGERRAIEISPGTIERAEDQTSTFLAREIDLGTVTLQGEVVDGKCYLGVMNPGEGPTHRDCAVRCIRGGLPPLFAVTTSDNNVLVFTLMSGARQPVNAQVASLVGRPIEITGRVLKTDGELMLLADPTGYRLLSR